MEWVRRSDGSVAHSIVVDGETLAYFRSLVRRDAGLAERYELRSGPVKQTG